MLRASLEEHGCASLADDVVVQTSRVLSLLPFREQARDYLMLGWELVRCVVLALAARRGLGGDIFFLELSEVRSDPQHVSSTLIADRRIAWRATRTMRLPEILTENWPADTDEELAGGREEVPGDVISAGRATGAVCTDVRRFVDGCVLVVERIEPTIVPLLMRASAVVVERGGTLSHGATIVRQLGLPGLVCPAATRQLATWQEALVDGFQGTVHRMS